MSDPSTQALSNGLVYEARVPLHWQVISSIPSGSQLESRNEPVIHFMDALDTQAESIKPIEPIEKAPSYVDKLARIETKLNLILDLLTHMRLNFSNLPEPVVVYLSAQSIKWQAAQVPETGQDVLLDIYLDQRCPESLRLAGRVKTVEYAAQGKQVCITLSQTDSVTHDWLEKLIFRNHRKSILRQRINNQT